MCNWAESYMDEGKGSKFCKRYTNMIYRLNDSFGREQCRFFDPSVKFGGPNPDESMDGMVAAKVRSTKIITVLDSFVKEFHKLIGTDHRFPTELCKTVISEI